MASLMCKACTVFLGDVLAYVQILSDSAQFFWKMFQGNPQECEWHMEDSLVFKSIAVNPCIYMYILYTQHIPTSTPAFLANFHWPLIFWSRQKTSGRAPATPTHVYLLSVVRHFLILYSFIILYRNVPCILPSLLVKSRYCFSALQRCCVALLQGGRSESQSSSRSLIGMMGLVSG